MDIFEKSQHSLKVNPMNHMLYDFDSAKIGADTLNAKNIAENSSSPNEVQSQTDILFENKENAGFLYFRPTDFHKKATLNSIKSYLPDEPYLIAYLIQKWEIPWAKVTSTKKSHTYMD